MHKDAAQEFNDAVVIVNTRCKPHVLHEGAFGDRGIRSRCGGLPSDGLRACIGLFLDCKAAILSGRFRPRLIPAELGFGDKEQGTDETEQLQRQQNNEQVPCPEDLKHMACANGDKGREARCRQDK